MADYPQHLVREHTLLDGRRVLIRPVHDRDERLEDRFIAGLSSENRYLRFQKWVKLPSDKLVQFLTHVDHDRHVALVCIASQGQGDEIVGEARYVVNRDATSCDFAVVVADAWHKSGIAGLLMQALIGAARERGLETMESEVLASNFDMLRFAHGLGFEVRHVPDELAVVRIVKRLQPSAPPGEHRSAPLSSAARKETAGAA